MYDTKPCGSGLAREEALKATTQTPHKQKRPRPFDRGRFRSAGAKSYALACSSAVIRRTDVAAVEPQRGRVRLRSSRKRFAAAARPNAASQARQLLRPDKQKRPRPFDRGRFRSAGAKSYALAFLAARVRSLSSRIFLRRRIDFGVTSHNSSSWMNSRACSRVKRTGGTRAMVSSLPEARMLSSFLPLVGLTPRSLSRLFRPTI